MQGRLRYTRAEYTRVRTFARNVCAAKSFAAAGASGDSKSTLHVAQASDWQGVGSGASDVAVLRKHQGEMGNY